MEFGRPPPDELNAQNVTAWKHDSREQQGQLICKENPVN